MDEGIFDCSICQDKLSEAMETKCCHHCYCKRKQDRKSGENNPIRSINNNNFHNYSKMFNIKNC